MLFNCYLKPHRRITIYRRNLTRASALALYDIFKAKGRAAEVVFENITSGERFAGSELKNYKPQNLFTEKKIYDEGQPSGHRRKQDYDSTSGGKVSESTSRELRILADRSRTKTDNTK